MNADDFIALGLTLRLAALTTLLLLAIAIPLAQLLNESRARGVWLLEALFSLPLVLPPTVIGFYLLLLFSPRRGFGAWWVTHVGWQLTFSFTGLVTASMIYSFPFALRPLQLAFRGVGRDLVESAHALGASRWQTFRRVVLPAARPGVLAAAALVFAHTVGEFGVVLMIGGNLPGETRVASVALYDAVQRLDYASANRLALAMLVLAFAMLALIHRRQRDLF